MNVNRIKIYIFRVFVVCESLCLVWFLFNKGGINFISVGVLIIKKMSERNL